MPPVVYAQNKNTTKQPASCQASSLWCVPAAKQPKKPRRTDFVKNELLILHDASRPGNFAAPILRKYNLREKASGKLNAIGQTLITAGTNGQDPLALVDEIKTKERGVDAATNNLFFTTAVEQKGRRKSYPLALTGIEAAHQHTKGKGIKICMIDTAIDVNHRSLNNSHVQSFQLIPGNSKSTQQHGTEVAGVIISQNPRIGVAPEATLLAVSTFSDDPKTGERTSNAKLVAQALDLCIRQRADILNLSFAGGQDVLVDKMIRKAIARGIVVVASAGNNGPGASPAYPAAIPDVIAVTAVDQAENIFGQANRGSYIDLAAPGVDILTTSPRGSFNLSSGTSLATAHVSGVIALLMSMNRQGFRPAILEKTAIDLGRSGRDTDFGYGLVNVEKALQFNNLN
ncbi:MAG: Peptidase S8 and S53 subtilisin kexin sedolisin [uncultured Thiotrichaceae bacterium]|uniref:Peptidase S8 and S53 subtilisin kexin sedolisin n=1 Tax=uncultured Thiotrichaceae bacterium TaxID=298394 RepID=A0A6S6U0U6_9GAMM|nr:MAG: Peptidase S8 and S53 subtilisin kexin sedolisin [uncultured Thiotrichaceae bacterium]